MTSPLEIVNKAPSCYWIHENVGKRSRLASLGLHKQMNTLLEKESFIHLQLVPVALNPVLMPI